MADKGIELLAPAGNMNCLKTAVNYGADAVYFAGKLFGARSFADNFSDEEIFEAAKFCRLHNVKTYVTVNTMLTDREFLDLDRFIKVLADAGVDGVIVQDLGVLKRIKEICPHMPVHASTQMTVHNLSGVRMLEEMGASRVVLARELSKKDISYIAENCNAELEVFVHGAMCMSYSGQCLMSSVLGGRSGNRGKCAQPCRLEYSDKGGKKGSYLSLLDMSLANHIEDLRTMGVKSLKIEGRMKGEEYIASVVGVYRRLIDEKRVPTKEELDSMNRVFFRGGLTDGYYMGRCGKEMFAFDKPDNPYARQIKEEKEEPFKKVINLRCCAVFEEGKSPEIYLNNGEKEAFATIDECLEKAQKNGADIENIKKQLAKTGGTEFSFSDISVEIKGNPFIPVKTVNELRRKAIEKMEDVLSRPEKKEVSLVPIEYKKAERDKKTYLTASVYTREQFDIVKKFDFKRIDVPMHLIIKDPDYYISEKERIVIAPPVIITDSKSTEIDKDLETLKGLGFSNLRAENIGVFQKKNQGFSLFGGHRLNLANHSALKKIRDLGATSACLSAELNLAQIRDLQGEIETEVIAYGHLPLMITENCILKNIGGCKCDGKGEIQDRMGVKFPIVKDGDVCRSILLNSIPIYMADKKDELLSSGVDALRLCFTIETKEECKNVCKAYTEGENFPFEYTRGHYYKGVK